MTCQKQLELWLWMKNPQTEREMINILNPHNLYKNNFTLTLSFIWDKQWVSKLRIRVESRSTKNNQHKAVLLNMYLVLKSSKENWV